MAGPSRLHRHSFQDYLALEEASNVKHEYLTGEIYGMAGGTPEHAALAVAVSSAFHAKLRGGRCRVFSSDLRIRVLATGLATYPDVSVVCGTPERDPESATTVVNPTVVVEVLSDGTEDYDRNEKIGHYRQIPSLAAIVFVSHRERRIEVWSRSGDAWVETVAGPGEEVAVPVIECLLPVDAVYGDLAI